MAMTGQQQKNDKITISYGVIQLDNAQFAVLLQFNVPTNQLALNDDQVDAMVRSLEDVKAKMIEHRKRQAEAGSGQ